MYGAESHWAFPKEEALATPHAAPTSYISQGTYHNPSGSQSHNAPSCLHRSSRLHPSQSPHPARYPRAELSPAITAPSHPPPHFPLFRIPPPCLRPLACTLLPPPSGLLLLIGQEFIAAQPELKGEMVFGDAVNHAGPASSNGLTPYKAEADEGEAEAESDEEEDESSGGVDEASGLSLLGTDETCMGEWLAGDKNHDGYVTEDEAKETDAEWIKVLDEMDRDHDGKISIDEFTYYWNHLRYSVADGVDKLHEPTKDGHPGDSPRSEISDDNTTDIVGAQTVGATGTISRLSLLNGLAFDTFDTDSSGHVELGEALVHGPIDGWTRSLEKYDTNKDTALSRHEFEELAKDCAETERTRALPAPLGPAPDLTFAAIWQTWHI